MYLNKLLTKNKFSRPATKLDEVKAIVIHWVANPKTTAKQNRDYFEKRKNGKHHYGSAHYIIDLNGDIMQCIPDDEVAYHCGSETYTARKKELTDGNPNKCTIGIELTHLDWEGSFSKETWDRSAFLTSLLLREYELTVEDIITHKEMVGWKSCPKFFTDHPEFYSDWLDDVHKYMRKSLTGVVQPRALNVRMEPNGKKTMVVHKGDIVDIIGWKDGWYKIKILDTKKEGYVASKYIKVY